MKNQNAPKEPTKKKTAAARKTAAQPAVQKEAILAADSIEDDLAAYDDAEETPTKLAILGALGLELSAVIEYVDNPKFPKEVAKVSKEYKSVRLSDTIKAIQKDIRDIRSVIASKNGYVVRVNVRKVVIKGFTDGCATYMHERALKMMSGLIYLMAAEMNKR